ncbi:hypothetical protein RUM44_012797 [Polyplax serrata]|uniref:glutathione-specific gamma-glutamylcyclotransferase n=1 Tax=Polyplax serrata TaxID=468196 RepID=A0ABR1BCD3_POLSC
MTTRRNLPPDTEPPSTSSSNRDERRRREDGEVATAEAATSAMTELKIQDFDWMDEDDFDGTGMWVFGYGSLCWHQGFTYNKSLTGCIRGFSRKFWQGNTTHRGTEKKPGRVVTLIEDEEGIVWGQAFQVKEKEAFSYLNNRECELGGYLTTISTFYPRPDAKANKSTKPFPVILYLATSSNRHWLGDSSLPDIANQIVECAGNSGHNVEYLLRLANFVRENIPEAVDEHLFTLERLVRSQIKEKNLCLKTLMGENKSVIDDSRAEGGQEQEPEGGEAGRSGSRSALHFTSRVSPKKLRCVNIC